MAAEAPPVSPVRTNKPELRIDAAAINDIPVELDGTPTTPARLRARATDGHERQQHAPAADEPISKEEKERLAKLISERKGDPAVLVDIPQTPQAEELNIAEKTK
ncbi:Peregrin [Sphaceloma murrayae]|uniref:Peregrin n=1 Tax=Sphaceloma murrayae TaxID=2082308 RepID=A0A2K1QYY3_9PEZI|nr:Peregrin [Sphaceloma murrayae]